MRCGYCCFCIFYFLSDVFEDITSFLFKLKLNIPESLGVDVIDPYRDEPVRKACIDFYSKYYSSPSERILILGINPGRFGSGLTGIGFTDPWQLKNSCGINHTLGEQRELSSTFIFEAVKAYGGPGLFFQQFLISAISPLGFIRDGKNINYYDDNLLLKSTESFIIQSIRHQHSWPWINKDHVVVIGTGKNEKIFRRLNEAYGWFANVISLEHPRYVMQYKRKQLDDYIQKYTTSLKAL